ncbi:hypothetical protein [Sanguibacter inulinus]|uniref:Uncharacterized protein n=1 Tax=Sanguibacter inulinus TaxID=60922 RepID=A0A853EUP5_9MICO|nr:hypothetical protein [Sanguibacter inulinus]MBF0721938.1 hypothetical protein [Sanguibacter inulinus]NYS93083.1 hypothetical protein [Sanguibacter inulinus]
MDGAAWVAIVGAAVASAAGLAAWLQVRVMKEQTELQRQIHRDSQVPYVWVDFRIDPVHAWLVHLVIKNEGPTVATNVRVNFNPVVRREDVNSAFGELASLKAFTNGIASLPPGREMRWTLGSTVAIYNAGTLSRHRVEITHESAVGQHGPLVYELDFGDFPGASAQPQGSLKRIEAAIKKQTQAIASIAQEVRKEPDGD